jgi:hypothetical protein
LNDPNYEIEAAARHLFGRLNGVSPKGEPPVLSKQQIVFVAHSTGGLVVRQMLLNEPAAFSEKKIGLFLLASPSRGSEWATRASGLTKFIGHKMIDELASNSPFTVRLDKLFSELLARKRIWMIAGMDVFESRFIVPGWFWNKDVVVNPDDSRYYFGEPRLVPNSDHFSISKPSLKAANSDAFPHEYLVEFFTQRFEPEAFALSQCQLNVKAELTHSNLLQLKFDTPAKQQNQYTRVQFTPEGSGPVGTVDEACLADKLNSIRQIQEFQSFGSVRCEGGGLRASGQRNETTIQFSAPPNMRIVGQATPYALSINRGELSGVKYKEVDGNTVAAEVRIACQSPSIPFGPGAWAEVRLAGKLEQVPTEDQIAQARKSCSR